jgi:hypothetical protein
MTAREELTVAVAAAIDASEAAAGSPDHLLALQAAAAVEAVIRSGWVAQAGWEYAAKRGDVTLSCGFHTADGAATHADRVYGDLDYTIERRPIGVWELVPESSDDTPTR